VTSAVWAQPPEKAPGRSGCRLDGSPESLELRGRIRREGPARAAEPVSGVGDVAFLEVDHCMRPAGQRRFVVIDDVVRLLPLAPREVPDRSPQRHASILPCRRGGFQTPVDLRRDPTPRTQGAAT
jgi:hypothetical protein